MSATSRTATARTADPRDRRLVRWWRLGWRDWLDVTRAVVEQVRTDRVPLVAAGVAFYAVLGLIPASLMAITLYGMVTSPAEAEAQIAALLDVLPPDAANLVAGQLRPLATSPAVVLSLGFIASAAGLLWSSSNATRAVVRAVVIAYNAEDEKSKLEGRAAVLGLTIAALTVGTGILAVVAVLPAWLVATDGTTPASSLRWVLLVAVGAGVSLLLFRYAPPRPAPSWGSLVPAAGFSALAWLTVSVAFSYYVSRFGSYNETYGVLGAAVILMLWFFLSVGAFVVGAEIAAELERHYAAR